MDKYIKLIEEKQYNELSNINFINELIEFKYKDKYLIEYLLEQGIHSDKMDNYLIHHKEFIEFYLKYNIIKPITLCSLKILLSKIDGNLILDIILNKLNYQDKINLYNNIRKISFSDFHYYEDEVINIYLKHGIVLNKLFIDLNDKDSIEVNKEDKELIDEFLIVFKDTEIKILNYVTKELKRNLLLNHDRGVIDIKRLIDFKRNNPQFTFIDSKNRGGESYDQKTKEFKTNTNNSLMYNHEFSHFLYESYEDNKITREYETIRSKIDTIDNLNKVKKYLKEFHQEYIKSQDRFMSLYNNKVNEKYGSFENYVEKIYLMTKDNLPDLIEIFNIEKRTISYPLVMDFNLKDVIKEYLKEEQKQFIYLNLRKYYSNYLMLENLLDALFKGKLFDDLEFSCLSGHGSLYFDSLDTRSFDECLANFDALRKNKENKIIDDLKELVGEDIIKFLENYITYNREASYGK